MFKMIAVTDETHICECCGKNNLKRVIVLENTETGAIVRYGSDCASKAMRKVGQNVSKSIIDAEANAIAAAQTWLSKGYTLAQVKEALWNKFGFSNEIKNGQLIVHMTTKVVLG